MKVLRRLSAAIVAIGLIVIVVYLGILSGKDNQYVVWFGIASAIVAPVGLTLFGYALSPLDRDLVQKLSKVPDIERLMQEAKSQEDKVRVLEAERERLAEVVKLEAKRQAIFDRNDSLERDAVRILNELDYLDKELKALDEKIGESTVSEEIKRLRERVKAREIGEVIFRFGSKVYRIDRDIIKAIPFGFGNIFLAYFRVLEHVSDYLKKRRRG